MLPSNRLFAIISQNWREKPIVSQEVIVNLISNTLTRKGLSVKCEVDDNEYPRGINVSNKELQKISLDPDEFHGKWNYTIHPKLDKM